MKLKLAGIIRKKEFSPNHEINDYMILYHSAEALKILGAEIKLYYEKDMPDIQIEEDFIFSMVLGIEGMNILRNYKKMGKMILNPPESIRACYRSNMIEILVKHNIPFPKSVLVSPYSMNGELHTFNSDKIWIKPSELGRVKTGDQISLNASEAEIKDKIKKSAPGQTDKIILQENLAGDAIKFYGIRETGFFHFYKYDNREGTLVNGKKLRELAEHTAEVMDLWIYGGDAIILNDGSLFIIDINNWPSFAPVRKEAAQHIAYFLISKSREFFKPYYLTGKL